jgi:putative transposase
MDRRIIFSEGEYYHVYNRGVEKRDIFLNQTDNERFLRLLFLANGDRPFKYREIQDLPLSKVDRGEPLVAIGAYCLMTNHFHVLVKEIREGGLSRFMEKLTTGYSKYFNKKYDRVGPLFQSRFKAEHVGRDEYLKYLYAYIHLNPIKFISPEWKERGILDIGKAKKHLQSYRYSSYVDHSGIKRAEGLILLNKEFPEYFVEDHEFEDFVKDWLEYKVDEDESSRLPRQP